MFIESMMIAVWMFHSSTNTTDAGRFLSDPPNQVLPCPRCIPADTEARASQKKSTAHRAHMKAKYALPKMDSIPSCRR